MTDSNSPCQSCGDDQAVRITDDECVATLHTIPLSLDLALVALQVKDKAMIVNDKLPAGHTVNEKDGIITIVMFETPSDPIDLSEVMVCTEKARHKAIGDGGVWNPRTFGCDSRTCSVDCGNASCSSIMGICKRRFDSVCTSIIRCIRC